MMIDSTEAKIGRSMKNRENTRPLTSDARFELAGLGHGLHLSSATAVARFPAGCAVAAQEPPQETQDSQHEVAGTAATVPTREPGATRSVVSIT